MSEQPIVAEHFDVGTEQQRRPMPTTDAAQPNGYDYTREDGQIIFVHDLGSKNDGTGRDPELAGQYDIYDGTGLDVLMDGVGGPGRSFAEASPIGRFTAPEPLPYPSAVRDLSEQFLSQEGSK